MNRFEFDLLLENCRQQLTEGKKLAEILQEHPVQADRLEPLLQAALLLQELPQQLAPESGVNRGRARLLSEAAELERAGHFSKNRTIWSFFRYSGRGFKSIDNLLFGKETIEMKFIPRLALYLLLTILVAGFFTVNASASSLPGDALYNLKLGWEQVQIALTFNDQTKLKLEDELEQERLSEVQSLLGEGRVEDVEFLGLIENQDGASWTISGIVVQIDANTELKGLLEIGTLVKVEALTQDDGSLLAIEIYPGSGFQSDSSEDDRDGTETPEAEESGTPDVDESETPDPDDYDDDDDDGPTKTSEPEKTEDSDGHDGDEDDDDDDDDDDDED